MPRQQTYKYHCSYHILLNAFNAGVNVKRRIHHLQTHVLDDDVFCCSLVGDWQETNKVLYAPGHTS